MRRCAFTLVEVLAMTLVVVLGLFSVTGLFVYGLRVAARAQAASTAMATAMSAAVDDDPWIDAANSTWTRAQTYSLDDRIGTAKATGIINGYFVERRESAAFEDILSGIPGSPGGVGARGVRVDVDVFDAMGGELLASFTTRLVRTRNLP